MAQSVSLESLKENLHTLVSKELDTSLFKIIQEYEVTINEQKARLIDYEMKNNKLQEELNLKIKENQLLEQKVKKYDIIADYPAIISKYRSKYFDIEGSGTSSNDTDDEYEELNKEHVEEFLDMVCVDLTHYFKNMSDLRNKITEFEIYERMKQQVDGLTILRSDVENSANEIIESIDRYKNNIREIIKYV